MGACEDTFVQIVITEPFRDTVIWMTPGSKRMYNGDVVMSPDGVTVMLMVLTEVMPY